MDNLDKQLFANPIKTSVRKTITDDTLDAMIQVKRARLIQRIITVGFIVMALLFILKWLSNDIFYLSQLLFNKFTLIKMQSNLYLAAVLESLPKQQLFILIIVGSLWIGWKRFETFLLHNRTIYMTSRLIVGSTVILITALGFAGYSYAQKTEQQKLELLKEHINASGRKEFETNIDTSGCNLTASTNNPNLINQYEVKKGTSLSSDDVKRIIEAACNNTEAEKFLKTTIKFKKYK